MAEKLDDVWQLRDYPVLVEACRRIDQGDHASNSQLEQATGLSFADIVLATRALQRKGLVTSIDNRGGTPFGITGVSGDAYQAVGLHPDPQLDLADLLVEGLLAAAEKAPDEADKSRLRRAAGLVGEVTKSTVAGVVSGIITSGITGA